MHSAFDEDKHCRQGVIRYVIPCVLTGVMNLWFWKGFLTCLLWLFFTLTGRTYFYALQLEQLLSASSHYLLSVSSLKESIIFFSMLLFSSTCFLSRLGKRMLHILMIIALEQCTEFCWFGTSIFICNLYFLSTLSFTLVQKVFGVVQLCSLSVFLVLSLSFEDALNSHGISGIISLFFPQRQRMYLNLVNLKCII